MRVGIIGCGNISDVYVRNAKLFNDIEIVACSDILPPAAERLARKYSLREMDVRALLAAATTLAAYKAEDWASLLRLLRRA